jgi:hypothetical protein
VVDGDKADRAEAWDKVETAEVQDAAGDVVVIKVERLV